MIKLFYKNSEFLSKEYTKILKIIFVINLDFVILWFLILIKKCLIKYEFKEIYKRYSRFS